MLQPNNFVEEIERLVKESRGAGYIDIILRWVTDNGFEPEYAADLVKKYPSLKAKVQLEAEELNFLKKESRLPL